MAKRHGDYKKELLRSREFSEWAETHEVSVLALNRSADEGVQIGENIRVMIQEVRGKIVTLALFVPRHIRITRVSEAGSIAPRGRDVAQE